MESLYTVGEQEAVAKVSLSRYVERWNTIENHNVIAKDLLAQKGLSYWHCCLKSTANLRSLLLQTFAFKNDSYSLPNDFEIQPQQPKRREGHVIVNILIFKDRITHFGGSFHYMSQSN